MANLKELLPMILGGLAGAASPRGAEVMTNVADMAQRRRVTADEGARRDKTDARSQESHDRQMKLSDLRLEDRDKAATKEAEEKAGRLKMADLYSTEFTKKWGETHPEIAAIVDGAVRDPSISTDTMNSLFRHYDDDLAKDLEKSDREAKRNPESIRAAVEGGPANANWQYTDQDTGVSFRGGGPPKETKQPATADLTKFHAPAKTAAKGVEDAFKAFDKEKNAQVETAKKMATDTDNYPTGTNPSTIAKLSVDRQQKAIGVEQQKLDQQLYIMANGDQEEWNALRSQYAPYFEGYQFPTGPEEQAEGVPANPAAVAEVDPVESAVESILQRDQPEQKLIRSTQR